MRAGEGRGGGEVIKCDECYKVTLRGEGKKKRYISSTNVATCRYKEQSRELFFYTYRHLPLRLSYSKIIILIGII